MLHYVLCVVAWLLARLPKNGFLYAYTINTIQGEKYLTRVLLPRFRGKRYMLHRIHREDDRVMHNHPWKEARTRILTGGYLEERANRYVPGTIWHSRNVGDVASLDAQDFHRIAYVDPRTWTLFTAGERVQKWGFATPEGFVDYDVYFANQGYVYTGVKS